MGDATTEATRAVAMAFYEAMEDIAALDAMLAPDAAWWGNGVGDLDRKTFLAVHKPYLERPEPTFRRTRLLGLAVEGERAAIEMEWEIHWPDLVYHQHYHHVLIVRDGKVQAFRMYSNREEGAKLFGNPRTAAPAAAE